MSDFVPTPDMDLYSESLRPVKTNERNVSAIGMAIIWFGLGVQMTDFLTKSAMLEYYTVGEYFIWSTIGQAILVVIGVLIWDIGLKHGISFATSVSSAFGTIGGKIIGIARILPGLFFFGVNGFMGGSALNEISKVLFNFDAIWLYVIINAAVLVFVVAHGSKGIEVFAKIAMPIMVVVALYLLYSVLETYGATLSSVWSMGGTGEHHSFFYAICIAIGGYTAVVIGMNDYGKDLIRTDEEASRNWWKRNRKFAIPSIILGGIGFGFITTLAVVCVGLTGEPNPLAMITQIVGAKSVILAVAMQLFIFVAQLSTNSGANLYPAVYVLCSLMPKRINVYMASIGFAAISVALRPWTFTGMDTIYMVIGSFAGPIFGIMVVDYYVFRKTKLDIDELYRTHGKYYYWKGFNIPAMVAWIVATGLAIMIPDYSFLVAGGFGGLLYYILAKGFSKKMPVMVSEETEDMNG